MKEMNAKQIEKDAIVTLTIEDMTSEGEGVGHVDGYALFVKDAVVGDVITAKVMKTKKTYGYARLMTIEKSSPDRVEAPCPNARACGGCTLMAMSYEAQLAYKQRLVLNNLTRIGGIPLGETGAKGALIEPILGMEEPFRYRNKAQFPVGRDRDGRIVMGFYAGRTHSIIPCEDCLIGSEANKDLLAAVKHYMETCGVEPYDEAAGTGLVRHVLIREGYATGEIMVCLVVNGTKLPEEARLIEALLSLPLPKESLHAGEPARHIASIVLNVNRKQTNVILGTECRTLYGRDYIEDCLGDVRYRISALSFYQVNPTQAVRLYRKALEYAELSGNETVWDLYCGIGTISLFLAKKAGEVYGVEIVPEAIRDAKANAALNGLANTHFYVGAAEEVGPQLYREQKVKADVIVVDPPRKGCEESLLSTMVEMAPKRIVYVSCDSATLARDLKYLTAHGYELKKVQVVDQFGHSTHVETCVLLVRESVRDDEMVSIKVDMSGISL